MPPYYQLNLELLLSVPFPLFSTADAQLRFDNNLRLMLDLNNIQHPTLQI
eukprot:Gb_00392 [translate_table: standard]